MAAENKPEDSSAKPALNALPSRAHTTKIRLAGNRSASPHSAKVSVPRMKPSCTAFVSSPIPETLIPHARIKSGAALFALNHKDVPNSCATAMVATGKERDTGIEAER